MGHSQHQLAFSLILGKIGHEVEAPLQILPGGEAEVAGSIRIALAGEHGRAAMFPEELEQADESGVHHDATMRIVCNGLGVIGPMLVEAGGVHHSSDGEEYRRYGNRVNYRRESLYAQILRRPL